MKLFGKDTKGNVKEWIVEVFGPEIHVSHGKLGGKMQTKVTVCKPKNVGKSNETTAEEQAILEAKSKYNKQIDKLYRESVEELESVGDELPMLAHDYTKVGHRMEYPCYVSPKLDGVRCIAKITPTEVTMMSRGGKQYNVPDHLKETLLELLKSSGEQSLTLDGELYIHGLSLQNIVSAVKKPNDDTPSLEFWIFDVPNDDIWEGRYHILKYLEEIAWANDIYNLKFVMNKLVENEDQARKELGVYLEDGYEGLMLRNPVGVYLFNHRSSDLMKWKEFQDVEAKVLGVIKDKLGEGILRCRLQSGVEFECKMKGNHEYRSFKNMMNLVHLWITVKFQAYTDRGAPQFPVGIAVRDCDSQGFPIV